jgi:hypothetical protein
MLSLNEARDRLSPIEPHLVDSFQAATARWRELLFVSPQIALPLDRKTRANIVHCHVCHEIEQRIADIEGVVPTEALGFFAVRVGDDLLLRFKFLRFGRPSNIPTDQQTLLAGQLYDEDMMLALEEAGFAGPPTLLTAGYSLDSDELAHVEIRCDCRGRQPWVYDIFGGDALAEPLVFPGMEDTARPAVVRSTRKRIASTEEHANDDAR